MTVQFVGEGALNNGSGGLALIAKYTHTNPSYWLDSQVTITTGNPATLTITSSGLANGDKVVFMPLSGSQLYRQQDAPGGICFGLTYYVVGVSGNTLQLSTTSGGAAIQITSAGTAGSWRLEKLDNTGSITISGLNEKAIRVVIRGATSGNTSGYGQLLINFNGVSTTQSYVTYYNNTSDTWGGNFNPHVWSNQCPFRLVSVLDFACQSNNVIVHSGYTGIEYVAGSQTAPATYGTTQSITSTGTSINNSAFSSIQSLTIAFGNHNLCGDFTVEVYRL